jgi:rRNA processing protein Gar1
MSFSGRVKNTSHEGGVIVAFEGKPPRLGASIRISGGKVIGRVDTVLGPVKSPFVHVHPLMEGIDAKASIGSPVEIAPRVNRGKGRQNRRSQVYKRGRNEGSRDRKRHPKRGKGSSNQSDKRSYRKSGRGGKLRVDRGPKKRQGRPNMKNSHRRGTRRRKDTRRKR